MFSKHIGRKVEAYIDDMVIKKQEVGRACEGYGGDFLSFSEVPNEVEPIEMCFWGVIQEIPRACREQKRNRTQSNTRQILITN